MPKTNYFFAVIRDELLAIKDLISENRLLVILIGLMFIVGLYFIDPIPGKAIRLAASGNESGYGLIAKNQSLYLSEKGISLEMKGTESSIESARLLADPKSDINAAFIQGGLLDQNLADQIRSLGSVAYEPVWIFYRKGLQGKLNRFRDLASFRVGVGPEGGGTNFIARQLFVLNGINISGAENYYADSYENNVRDFLDGKLDVLINVNPEIDPLVRRLLFDPNVEIFELTHAEAYDKHLPFVKMVTLPAAAIDIAKQIPPKNISLLATSTSLAVKKDMHPSLQVMLLMAAKDAQRVSKSLFLSNEEKLPAYIDRLIPLSTAASDYYDYGVPQALRYLPYRLAGFIDRMWIYILGLFAIIYPLTSLNINLRSFRFGLYVQKIDRELLLYQRELNSQHITEESKSRIVQRLEDLIVEVSSVSIPVGCEKDYFVLVNLLNGMLEKVK